MDSNHRLGEMWLEALAAERGIAGNTFEAYRSHLEFYFAFLDRRGATVETADQQLVVDYLTELDAAGFATGTIIGRRAVLTGLHGFLADEKIRPDDPTSQLSPQKRERSLPTVLSIAEVGQLFEAAHAQAENPALSLLKRASHSRRVALLEVLYASGMRISEAVTLPARTAKTKARHLTIRGKGDKERIVPLNDSAMTAITRWRHLAAEYGTDSGTWLFHSVRDGRKHLTTRAAELEIKDAAASAGLSRPDLVTPHVLRHAFATHLLANGADLRVIQSFLGHADLATTEIYTHVDISRSKAMVVDLHPLND